MVVLLSGRSLSGFYPSGHCFGVEPHANRKMILPYLFRTRSMKSLPCTHLSEGFLYSSITFAFLLVSYILELLVQDKLFSLKRKKKKIHKRNISHSRGPIAAPGCKQQQVCGKAEAGEEVSTHRPYSNLSIIVRWGRVRALLTNLCGNRRLHSTTDKISEHFWQSSQVPFLQTTEVSQSPLPPACPKAHTPCSPQHSYTSTQSCLHRCHNAYCHMQHIHTYCS